eukprot:2530088-Amphidinium_carterae.1
MWGDLILCYSTCATTRTAHSKGQAKFPEQLQTSRAAGSKTTLRHCFAQMQNRSNKTSCCQSRGPATPAIQGRCTQFQRHTSECTSCPSPE